MLWGAGWKSWQAGVASAPLLSLEPQAGDPAMLFGLPAAAGGTGGATAKDLSPSGAGEVPPLSLPFFLSLSLLQTTGPPSSEPFTPHCCAEKRGYLRAFGSAGSQHQCIPPTLPQLQQLPCISGNDSHG